MRRPRGMTLLEVLVALAVLAIGVTALQGLLAASVRGIATDVRLTEATLLARSLLAEAEVRPPEPGHVEGERPGALRYARDTTPTPHPGLREVRVRVSWEEGQACELVEMVRVPPP
ncbi:MAG: prepilin-type N-terminal cleavage/methylation domain-containing protein [Deltaproteobacteria bacterium]|nr:MAG: prepilin-type N-terminal cleavage/methylation domain-containing protein [Deltaproteobacteria bacterium]